MIIALASPPIPRSVEDGLTWLDKLTREAAASKAAIICFPETFIPGYPLEEQPPPDRTPAVLEEALNRACKIAAENNITIILPMDWYEEGALLNVAFVISSTGAILGYQTKNQLDPTEDQIWKPGTDRQIFEVNGLKFGITICHEGFRYPESVRWAARQDAAIVFHPHCTGSNVAGPTLTTWGDRNNPYYEKAMMMRAMENTIFFASSNYTMRFPESASSLIAPDGQCLGHGEYGVPGVLVATIDPGKATGLLAKRFKPWLYQEGNSNDHRYGG